MGFYAGPIPFCTSPDIVLQTSGDHFFVVACKNRFTSDGIKTNQYIGDEYLTMLKMAGMRISIINWQGKTIQTINY